MVGKAEVSGVNSLKRLVLEPGSQHALKFDVDNASDARELDALEMALDQRGTKASIDHGDIVVERDFKPSKDTGLCVYESPQCS